MLFAAAVKLAVAAAVLALAGTARAQPAAPPLKTLSLKAALAYARDHQPSLAAARARVDVAREQAALPRAAWSPRIVAGAELLVGTTNNTTTSYGGPLGFDVPRIGGTPANADPDYGPEPNTLVGVGVRQELFDFGRLTAQADAADAFARAAADNAEVSALDLDLYVAESFYAVVGAHAVLHAAEAAVTRAQAHRDYAQARVDAKLLPPLEGTRADADLARYQVEQIRAQGSLAAAQAVLAAAIGAPDAAIDTGADDVAYEAAPAASADALQLAETRDPSVAAATDLLRGQEHVTRAIAAELHPELSLSATVSGRAGGAAVATNDTPTGGGWLPDVANWDALVVISWPLFDRTVSVREETSRRLERVRAAEIDEARQRLHGAAAQTLTALQVAVAALPALARSVDAARANEAQAAARFSGGLATALEVADAEALLTDAEIQLAVGQFQLARARARLARVLAEPLATRTP
ncbi:MAG TPA: TolC family protein [Kofleriaceae bacterium]|jgi:outer membrane protein